VRIARIAVLACAAGLVLGGCGEEESAGGSVSLPGTRWLLDVGALGGAGSEDVTSDLAFDEDGGVSGSDGCNRFSGPYEADGSALRLGPLASTQMACAGAAQKVADRVSAALDQVRSYSAQPDTLVLKDGSGEPLLRYRAGATGVAGAWTVVSVLYDDAIRGVIDGTRPTATFTSEGKVSGSAGCNTFSGPYEEDGATLRIGPLASTRRACTEPEGAAAQEAGYLAALESVVRSERAGPKLTLFNAKGQMAVTLTGAP
jgi:heat shock protein HslJ